MLCIGSGLFQFYSLHLVLNIWAWNMSLWLQSIKRYDLLIIKYNPPFLHSFFVLCVFLYLDVVFNSTETMPNNSHAFLGPTGWLFSTSLSYSTWQNHNTPVVCSGSLLYLPSVLPSVRVIGKPINTQSCSINLVASMLLEVSFIGYIYFFLYYMPASSYLFFSAFSFLYNNNKLQDHGALLLCCQFLE